VAGLVIFLAGSVGEAAVLRARSGSLEKQADVKWDDGLFAGIEGKGANTSVHGKGVNHPSRICSLVSMVPEA
jgi:hypothetical protein